MARRFENRAAAGRELAGSLHGYARRQDVLVLGLPRGGVPVACEVARALGVELDVLVVRKLGVPEQPELAVGAIASGGARFVDRKIQRASGVDGATLRAIEARARAEMVRRERLYRGVHSAAHIRGRTVIVVDDGMATGASLRVATRALRSLGPARVIVAVPVAPAGAAARFGESVDEFVCLESPADFLSVGQFYDDFTQVSDAEVSRLLEHAGEASA